MPAQEAGQSCCGQQVDDVGGVRETQGVRRQHQWCHIIIDDAIFRVYVRRLMSTFLQYSPMKGSTAAVIFFRFSELSQTLNSFLVILEGLSTC